jgi:hypothetical protein
MVFVDPYKRLERFPGRVEDNTEKLPDDGHFDTVDAVIDGDVVSVPKTPEELDMTEEEFGLYCLGRACAILREHGLTTQEQQRDALGSPEFGKLPINATYKDIVDALDGYVLGEALKDSSVVLFLRTYVAIDGNPSFNIAAHGDPKKREKAIIGFMLRRSEISELEPDSSDDDIRKAVEKAIYNERTEELEDNKQR